VAPSTSSARNQIWWRFC